MKPFYYKNPCIVLVIVQLIGIIIGTYYPYISKVLILSLAVVTLWFLFNYHHLMLLIIFFIFGYLSIIPFSNHQFPANHIIHFVDRSTWQIVGVINQRPLQYTDKTTLDVSVEELSRGNKCHNVYGTIRVNLLDQTLPLSYGMRIQFKSKLYPLSTFKNPGALNYKRYMMFKGIFGKAYIKKKNHVSIVSYHAGDPIRQWIETSRSHIAALITKWSSSNTHGILKGFLIGDRSEIQPHLREAFIQMGLAHMLAISGLHIGMVFGFSFTVIRFLLSRSTRILWTGFLYSVSIILAMIPTIMYGCLAGLSIPTIRSLIMISVFVIAYLIHRERDAMNTLALSAIIMLAWDPPSLYDISFQLSFSAVAVIIMGYSNLSQIKRFKENRLIYTLIQWPFMSFLATIGTFPLLLYYFNNLSLIGFVSNIVFVPWLSFLCIIPGLIGVLMGIISPIISGYCIAMSSWALDCAIYLIHNITTYPISIKTISPSIIEIVIYYSILVTLLTFTQKWAKYLLFLLLLLVGIDTGYWIHQRFFKDNLTVTILDVSMGNAALLELPQGETWIIDGGGFPGTSFDVGEKIIAPVLWRKKIITVDRIILTHADYDHIGGLLYIAQHFNVKELWTSPGNEDSNTYESLLNIAKNNHIIVKILSKGYAFQNDLISFSILYPPDVNFENNPVFHNRNNRSLVIHLCYDQYCFLFPGDIEKEAEKELLSISGDQLQSQVLISPHHGSGTSSSEEFMKAVSPHWIVISTQGTRYETIPHPEVIQRYYSYTNHVFRTDYHGAIEMQTNGKSLMVTDYLRSFKLFSSDKLLSIDPYVD